MKDMPITLKFLKVLEDVYQKPRTKIKYIFPIVPFHGGEQKD